MKNSIDHIAFIMDGNNRWSKLNKKDKKFSYKKGANNLLNLSNFLFENTEVKIVSAFALSSHNLKRSRSVIFMLKELITDFVNKELLKVNYKFSLKFIGDLSFLNKSLIAKMNTLQERTANFPQRLNIFINYTGQNDLIRCFNNMLKDNVKISDKNIKKYLQTNSLPDPSILIRTGGYKRLSNFMLYQLSFTELFFSKKLWPDFTKQNLIRILNEYRYINRKFGL